MFVLLELLLSSLSTADSATMIEVNHDAHEVSVEQLRCVEGDISGIPPTRESVSARLNAPGTSTTTTITTTYKN